MAAGACWPGLRAAKWYPSWLTLIYLHQVRGIPLAVTGALFAAAVMGLVTVPVM